MTTWRRFVVFSGLVLAVAAGCTKKQAAPAQESGVTAASVKVDAGPTPAVGMDDPFVRLNGDAAKSLKAGQKAMQGKRYDEARAAFAAVVSAAPDYSPARMQEVKAATLGGHVTDVPALWKDLLARDFVAFVGRLDKPKELAPLRAGPEWGRIKALEASIKPAYAADLGKGLFFIARSRDLAVKPATDGTAQIELNQELFQVDLASQRYRRLSETEGRVFAYSVAPERKAISFLVVARVAGPAGPAPQFFEPSVGAIDLATLETTGPVRLGPPGTRAAEIVMGWSGRGDPIWIVRGPGGGPAGDETSYALDATRTAAVAVGVSGIIPTHRTTATPSSVSTSSLPAEQISLSEDRKSVQIADEDRTLRATRVLDPGTIRFAPAGRRLVYAGAFDECSPAPRGKPEKNELYLWDRRNKAAARIATAASAFRVDWSGDDRLVYQARTGRQSRIHVLDVATKTDTVLKPRAAALVGFDAVVCPGASPEGEEDFGDEDSEGD
jgi:hypothetical protein